MPMMCNGEKKTESWNAQNVETAHIASKKISSVCGVCVLKREHHCMFAGYCVGHFNHRFFVLFLAWLWLGVLYCTYLNSLYVWTGEIPKLFRLILCKCLFAEFENVSLSAMFKFVFPLLILMSGMDLSWTQVILPGK